MALHKVVVRSSTIVVNNTQNSFAFAAPIPPLGAFTMPEQLVSVDDAYLLVRGLGGAAFGGPFSVYVRVNGTSLGLFQFDRWTSHLIMVPTVLIVPVPRGILITGNTSFTSPNVVVFEALQANDYFFVGPVVCHY
jgi:hypothetical protein